MENWEKRAVLMPATPLGLCEDKMADAMATALAAIEQREGERRGWDKPARLFTVHLADLDARSIELRIVPARLWGAQVRNPADAIGHTAQRLPAVPTAVEHRSYADAPVAGIAAMFEGWGRPADREPTEYEQRSNAQGRRVNHLAPDRIESRLVYAVDINQVEFYVRRCRGQQPHVLSTAQRDQTTVGTGLVPLGLGRIAHALREGHPAF
ncbi:hypothetical protein [Streptomyces sp. NRRL S-350]|uniref:hypothetical protein n=1 Tax=Streptomyces sp. NRRL S-350 TaxID=1463902 RepID=UPI0004C1FA28|nr:hypothetical protein [Streptomyces sp. NRRL S-350]